MGLTSFLGLMLVPNFKEGNWKMLGLPGTDSWGAKDPRPMPKDCVCQGSRYVQKEPGLKTPCGMRLKTSAKPVGKCKTSNITVFNELHCFSLFQQTKRYSEEEDEGEKKIIKKFKMPGGSKDSTAGQ